VVALTLLGFDTLALFFAAALHVQGVHIPLGSAVFDEPQIVPAAIVEGLAGGLFAVAAVMVFLNRRGMWWMALVAHVCAILGFLLGLFATRDGTSPFNRAYHLVMLGVFIVGLAFLLAPTTRAALGHGWRGSKV
jgi:hypothetical protein